MKECEICKKQFVAKGNTKTCSLLCSKELSKTNERKRRDTDKRRDWWVKYHSKNRNKKREKDRLYYKKNKERIKAYHRDYRSKNKEKCLMQSYAWKRLKQEMGDKCEKCGETENLHIHHKQYVQINSKEFKNFNLKQLELLCPSCHKLTHTRGK